MTKLSLSLCFCGVLCFAGWLMYLDLLRQNSNQYFQMYARERNYQLETERLKEDIQDLLKTKLQNKTS